MGLYWGWVVCITFLIIFTMTSGITFSFSEMIIPISRETKAAMSTLTWLGPLPPAIAMMGAPLATWLHYRVGTRILVLGGVFLTSLAPFLMSIATDIVTMLGVFGFMCGVGVLLIANPPFFLIDGYFPYEHPRHVLTTSIVACSYPLATLIFNPLTYTLLSTVGWRWTYAIYSIAMLILGLISAAIFRPHTAQELEEELKKNQSINDQSMSKCHDVTLTSEFSDVRERSDSYELISSSGDGATKLSIHIEPAATVTKGLDLSSTAPTDLDQSTAVSLNSGPSAGVDDLGQKEATTGDSDQSPALMLARGVADTAVTDQTACLPDQDRSTTTASDVDQSQALLDVNRSTAAVDRVDNGKQSQSGGSRVELSEISEKTPLTSADEKRSSTSLIVIMGILWFMATFFKCMGYYTPIFILVKQMEIMDIPQSQASRAMSLIGSCEVISRLLTSYLGDRFKGNLLYMYVICTLLMCVQNGLGVLATTYTHILLYSAALGIFGGPIIAAMYSSCSEVLLGQYVPQLFSTFRVALGAGAIVGPTIAGAIYDHTGSFNGVFYVNSVAYALASVLYAIIIAINRICPAWMFKRRDQIRQTSPNKE